jgi:hypothetical protein
MGGILLKRLKVVLAYGRKATEDCFPLGLAVLGGGVSARRVCSWMCAFSESGLKELHLTMEATSTTHGSGPLSEGEEDSPQRHSAIFRKT